MDTNSLVVATSYADFIAYIGFFFAVIGWVYQVYKNRKEKSDELRTIWENISLVKGAMSEIESEVNRGSSAENLENQQVELHQAHALLAALFRTLLTRAIAREGNVSLKTIKVWRLTGKLSSDWQQKCAMTVLLTSEISAKDTRDLDEKYSNWDAVDNSSPIGSRNMGDDSIKKDD